MQPNLLKKCSLDPVRRFVWQVIIGEEMVGEAHEKIFGKPPKIPNEMTTDSFFEMEKHLAKGYCLRRLAIKNRYSGHLFKELQELSISSKTAQSVISELTALRYIDDEAWVRGIIRKKSQASMGKEHIRVFFRFSGVKEALFSSLLEEEEKDEEEEIKRFLKKRLFKDKQKAINSLKRRGYAYDQILAVLAKERLFII